MLPLGLTCRLDGASLGGQIVLCRLEHEGYKGNRHEHVFRTEFLASQTEKELEEQLCANLFDVLAQRDTVVPLNLREVSDRSPPPQHWVMAQSMPDSGMSQQKILKRQYRDTKEHMSFVRFASLLRTS